MRVDPYRLVVTRHGLVLDEVEVGAEPLNAGRDPGHAIHLDDPSTSRNSARFELRGEELWVVDPGSLDTLRVNGREVEECRIEREDKVEVGPFAIEVQGGPPRRSKTTEPGGRKRAVGIVQREPGAAEAEAGEVLLELKLPGGEVLRLGAGEHTVGRDADCEIPIVSPAVSKQHARLSVSEAGVVLRDLGSTNGTKLGTRRIETAELVGETEISFGDVKVEVRLSGALAVLQPPPQEAAGATVLMSPGAEPDAKATLLTGRDLLEQASSLPVPEPEAPPRRRPSMLLVAVATIAIVVVGAAAVVKLRSPAAPEPQPIERPAPEPARPAAAEPAVSAAELYREGQELLRRDEIEATVARWERALAMPDRPAELIDDYAELLYRIGYVYEGDGQLDKARQTWQRLLDRLSDQPEHEFIIKARVRLRRLGQLR